MNTSTSGKWVTVWLLLATFLPVIIQIDGFIALIRDLFSDADVEPFFGFKYNFLVAGLALTMTYWALVFYYQRSFDYAITSNAVIFKHACSYSVEPTAEFSSIESQRSKLNAHPLEP